MNFLKKEEDSCSRSRKPLFKRCCRMQAAEWDANLEKGAPGQGNC